MSDTPQDQGAVEAPRRRTRKAAAATLELEALRAENARLAAEVEDGTRAIESLRAESGRHAEARAAADARVRQLQTELDAAREAAAARAETPRERPARPEAPADPEKRDRAALAAMFGGELAGALGELRLRVRTLQQLAGSALVPSTERVTATARQAEHQLDRLERALADVRGNA